MKKSLVALLLCAGIAGQSVSAANFGACTHMGLGSAYDNVLNVKSAGELELGWIRDECRWNYMQSGKDGKFTIREKDMDYIKRVDEAGINQLLLLAYGNTSYDGVTDDTAFPTQDNLDYYNGFLDYVRYTVETVGDYVDAYEIWNEPNIESFNVNGTATDYAKLFLDSKAIIDELDPTARVICGSITGADGSPIEFAEGIFDYIKAQGDVNELIDIFSIHLYTSGSDENYRKSLNTWEEFFDSYGFTGDVWMTENGSSAGDGLGEEHQAAYLSKIATHWDNWLNANNRNGINIWYDLRNDVGISDYEDNLGLVNAQHHIKPAGKAMLNYNRLLGSAKINGVSQIKTKDNFLGSDEYGYLGTYSDFGRTIYVGFDSNDNNKTTNVTLSGDVAYVYDYTGTLTETITSPTESMAITLADKPVFVEVVTYETEISEVAYDDRQGVINVSGKSSAGDIVTIELMQDGNVIKSQKAKVTDSEFAGWISVLDSGEYTLRVGYPELTALGKANGWSEYTVSVSGVKKSQSEISVAVAYSAEEKKVSLEAAITNPAAEQYVTVLVVPKSMDVSDIDMDAVGYIRQLPVEDGKLSAEFTLPDYFTTDAAVYLGGTGIDAAASGDADIAESDYLYVAGFDMTKGDSLSASALCRNFNETERKATIMIAQYDELGNLEDVAVEKKTIPAKSYAIAECKLEGVAINSDATSAKAYIWDDISTMMPLADFDTADF